MRKYTILLAAAPLAMLAACADNAEEAPDADTDTAMTADTTMPEPEDTPGPATSLSDAGDYSGTYSFAGEDGTTQDVTFNSSDNTYSYTDTSGTEQTGKYTVAPDGYRVQIPDFSGSPAWFAFRDGSFYRLPDNVEVTPESVVSGERYSRSGEDGAVFSRNPEPGSPVAPDDL